MITQLLQDHFFWKILCVVALVPWLIFSFLGRIKPYRIFLCLLLILSNIAACMQYGYVGFVAHIAICASMPIGIMVAEYVVAFFIWLRLKKEHDCELSPFGSYLSKNNMIRTYKLILSGDVLR